MPFEELPHTADRCLRVRAIDLPGLFKDAARGMYALSGAKAATSPRTRRTLELTALDTEGCLVSFLTELVVAMELDQTVYGHFTIHVEPPKMLVRMDGTPLKSLRQAIKAVTWHNLQIQHNAEGYSVEIVFDV
jgi:SHS2 domain-containing protein